MGLDIYGFIEYKRPDESEWLSFADRIRLDRDYVLFEKLGVRASESAVAIVAHRGLPKDISVSLRHYLNTFGGGEEAHSWMTLSELEEISGNHGATYKAVTAAMKALESGGNSTRFVYMFEG